MPSLFTSGRWRFASRRPGQTIRKWPPASIIWGRFTEAWPLYRRLLAIDEKATDEKDASDEQSELASTLNDLGSIYLAEGKYAQAEPIYKQAAALADRNFPKEPLAATIFSDFAR